MNVNNMQPVKDYKQEKYPKGDVTQWFGENPDLYRRFGMFGHNGIDIVRPHGSDLLAVEDGVVVEVKYDEGGFGKHIRFFSNPDATGIMREWTYGHLHNIHVAVGEKVKAGSVVGTMGNTGFVVSGNTPFWKANPYAGTHLHLGVREVVEDPNGWAYNSKSPRIHVIGYNNGYKGAIDPRPFLYKETIQEPTESYQTKKQLVGVLQSLVGAMTKLIGLRNEKNTRS